MIAQTASRNTLWNRAASCPIGVTCSWMPLRPSGSPIPGVGIMWPTVPGTIAVAAGAVARASAGATTVDCAVEAGAGVVGVWAAAGVSPAAARAIAHPINRIVTPDTVIGTEKRRDAHPDLGASIGWPSGTLKRLLQVLKRPAPQPN